MISGKTRVFALLGNPVAHSLSPAMHNAAFLTLGLPAAYVALPTAPEHVGPLIAALTAAGGGGNVTVPHKQVAARAVRRLSPTATALDACNTFWAADGASAGENTDVAGVLAALDRLDPPAGPWLVLGTGGSARAVVEAARRRGVAVAVRSRDADRARAFTLWAVERGVPAAAASEARLCVNTTPLGLRADDPLPIAAADLRGVGAALDLVYTRGETRWVQTLRAAGLRAADGREMLVAQGAAAFACWFPDVPAPVDVMRAAVHAALR